MKHRIGPLAGSLVCAAFLAVACGGSSFEGSGGSAGSGSGGENAAGTQANGGTSNAGTTSGGTSSAGTSSAGKANGGSATGGSATGGNASGGSANGGSAGSSAECNEDADCMACAYPTAPQAGADCYCASCAGTPLPKTTCSANQTAWTKQCAGTPRPCPAIACVIPPVPQCKSHLCVAAK